jgi:hypothetical protein
MSNVNDDTNDTPTTDGFDEAFDQASSGLPAPAAVAATPADDANKTSEAASQTDAPPVEPAPAAEAPPAAPTTEQAAAEIEANAAAPAAVEKPAPAPAAPPVPQLDPEFLAQAIAEATRRNKAAEPAQPAAKQEYVPVTAEAFLNDADKAGLAKFKNEWPDEFPALQALIKAEAQAIVANSNHQLVTQLDGVLAPLQQSTQKAEVNSHLGAIRAAHPDLDSILDKVPAWIESQPAILRPQFQNIYQKGSAGEVVEMLNMYKASANPGAAPATPAPAAAQQTPAQAAKPKTPVAPAAVAATAAVPASQRTNQSKGTDPNDFDAAFNEAAAHTS